MLKITLSLITVVIICSLTGCKILNDNTKNNEGPSTDDTVVSKDNHDDTFEHEMTSEMHDFYSAKNGKEYYRDKDAVDKFKPKAVLERSTLPVGQIVHPYDLFQQYRIAPGDVLDVLYQIRTWVKKDDFKIAVDHTVTVKFVHSSELNESQRIRPDGNISLPYLGDVYVIDKTVSELRNELIGAYSNILKKPEIYVLIPEFRSGIRELKKDLHTAPRGLSRLVTVRPDGYVTFPMLGDIFVARRAIPEINQTLNQMYEEILPGLHCDLFLERHSGSVVYVLGEVLEPGSYKISKPTTVIESIALAGGFIPGAKLSNVVVARKDEDKIVATKLNLKKVLALKENSQFFYLQPDDIVYVPKTIIKRSADVANDLADIFFFRGWSTNLSFSYDLNKSSSGRSSGSKDAEDVLPVFPSN